jgi:hypothetical protein
VRKGSGRKKEAREGRLNRWIDKYRYSIDIIF